MTNWRKTLVGAEASLREVMAVIEASELQIALVADENGRLLGVITDGDLRRGLLRGLTLEAQACEVMTREPTTVDAATPPKVIKHLMYSRQLRHIPVLDKDKHILDLLLEGYLPLGKRTNQVFLMAGGLGTRLGDLTKDIPKPLLKVGDKPILETILGSFIEQGFHRFTIAVNYKSDLIKAYFRDGSRWNAEISYLHETKRMGTCGALSLLDEVPAEPFFVMNGDLLTKIDFAQMLAFHSQHGRLATMAVREYDLQIPFGVVEADGDAIKALHEKPMQRYFVNAGVYILNPACLSYVPKDTFFDMTQLFQTLLEHQQPVANYPVYEYWLDIGRISDYERANLEYPEHWPPSERKGTD